MSQDTETKQENRDEFSIMEAEDEKQILNADAAVKQAFCYKVNGKTELSYVGLKHLVLLMSQKHQPLEILDSKMELLGEGTEKIWYATVKVRNIKTGYESLGMSESPYYFGGAYDKFGRTKALSKAERNAWRKQIPEMEIKALIDNAIEQGSVKEMKTLKKSPEYCDCKPGTNQKDMSKNECLVCHKQLKSTEAHTS